MTHRRKYKSGTSWCIWRWTDTNSEYLTRLHLLKTPWFAVCLHWLHKPDPEPWLHDHPVSFLSVMLRGGYQEYRRRPFRDGVYLEKHNVYNHVKADSADSHRIVRVRPNTLTLCFMGPKVREWGYHTPEGWVYWKDYEDYDVGRPVEVVGPA